ncbi:MAG: DeoR/GlpR family DNA-binding transcription regulator [Cyclobacteriaceae bacterium]
MLKRERHNYILEEIRFSNKVISSELCQQLRVSEDTIRRDLKELSDNGKILKVHGGAMATSSYIPFSHRDREIHAHEEKVVIVKKALSLVQEDQVILMDGGTTNLEFVRLLPQELKATIFTNSLPVATQLADHPQVEIILLGGKIIKNAQVSVGFDVINVVKEVQADLCFVGTRSIHANKGLTDINREEVMVKRALMNASSKVVSLCISEKLDTIQSYHIHATSKVDLLITELDPSNPRLYAYINKGIEIL